uniref:glycerol-1-phosphatase n=1 Tax=Aegilops tauschii TaxID=37682 RepID=M8B2I4_AEGTA
MASVDAGEGQAAPAPAPRATVSHVIFDMDGLLLGTRSPLPLPSPTSILGIRAGSWAVDTEGFYTEVQEKILARYGKVFDWSLKAKMMGKKAMESARIFVDECGLAGLLTPEQFLEEREGMLQELFPSCAVLPGVVRLIHHLHANKVPICVATGSHKRHFALKTQNHQELFALMHHVVMGDDPEVKAGKPSPDIFLAAMRRFEGNVEPSNCLVFEDAPSGVGAAKNAGMYAVMVPDPRLDISYHKEADQVLSSLLDFKPTEWGLPPFKE